MNEAEAFQRTVSIFDVFDLLGVEHRGVGTYQISCPNPGHEDTNPSARVYAGSNTVFCWTCHQTWDVVGLVQVVQECGFRQACDFLELKFGVPEYSRDPLWIAKCKARRRDGFVTDKSVQALAVLVHGEFVKWYKTSVDFPGISCVFEAYSYWCCFFDELVVARVGNEAKIKLLKEWLSAGKVIIARCTDISTAEVRPEVCVEPRTYSRASCTGEDIQYNENAGEVHRQCVQCFRDHWRVAEHARLHAARVASHG